MQNQIGQFYNFQLSICLSLLIGIIREICRKRKIPSENPRVLEIPLEFYRILKQHDEWREKLRNILSRYWENSTKFRNASENSMVLKLTGESFGSRVSRFRE